MSRFRFKKEEFVPQKGTEKEELEKTVGEFNEDARDAIYYFEPSDPTAREVEKTQEDMEVISHLVAFVIEEMRHLGLEERELSEHDLGELIQRIHFLKSRNKCQSGFFHGDTRNIEIYLTGNKLHDYASLLHEMLHLFSSSEVYLHPDKSPKIKVGYSIGEKLEAFNEAVTEKLTNEILLKHKKELSSLLHISQKEIDSYVEKNRTYESLRHALSLIVARVSKETGMDIDSFWEKVKRAYFNGKLFFLRDFQKFYGEDFLWFLIRLNELIKKGELHEEDIPHIVSSREHFRDYVEKLKRKENRT